MSELPSFDDEEKYHGDAMDAGHSFIPMGCNCFRVKSDEEPLR